MTLCLLILKYFPQYFAKSQQISITYAYNNLPHCTPCTCKKLTGWDSKRMLICCFLWSVTYLLALKSPSYKTCKPVVYWLISLRKTLINNYLIVNYSLIDQWVSIPCSSLFTSFDISARMQGCGTPLKKLRIVPAKQNNPWSSFFLNMSKAGWIIHT